ncbi:MAG TPA: serine hydrolase, partial [Planctomycetota bacterium]|nr:serine hydrolase [Planctomycetota bacterium]
DYATLIAQRITGPLGMVSTGLSIPEGAASREAAPYDVSLDPDSLWHFQAMVSAGGIRSSVRDMLRLAQATVAAPEGVLGAALELSMRPTFEVDETLSMGLGWHRNPQLGLVWHNGQTGGFHSYLCVCPSEDLAVVVLCNTASGLVDQLGSNLMAELRGQATRPWDYEAEHPQPRERLAGLVGTYDLAPGVKVEVTLDERGLLGQLTGQPAVRLLASDADHFFLRVVDARVTFERDADGRGMALILHQGGRDQRAPRRESAPESK